MQGCGSVNSRLDWNKPLRTMKTQVGKKYTKVVVIKDNIVRWLELDHCAVIREYKTTLKSQNIWQNRWFL